MESGRIMEKFSPAPTPKTPSWSAQTKPPAPDHETWQYDLESVGSRFGECLKKPRNIVFLFNWFEAGFVKM
jgi:hypothetical protein